MMSTSFLLAEISPSYCEKGNPSNCISPCFSASYQRCHKTEATGACQCSTSLTQNLRHKMCVLRWRRTSV